MYVDDLTLVTAAQLLEDDNFYVGRPGDPDPDRRTTLAHLAARILGDIPDDLDDLEARADQLEDDVAALAIESGSNENGNYVRFPDGTQIVWSTVNVGGTTINTANGFNGGYRSGQITFPMPAAFSHTLRCIGIPVANPEAVFIMAGSPSSTEYTLNLYAMGQMTLASRNVIVMAIGRWK